MEALTDDREARRQARKALKAQRLAKKRIMHRMRDQGFSPEEIASAMEMTREAYKKFRRKEGIVTPIERGVRRLAFDAPAEQVELIRALAERAGCSVNIILRRLIICNTAENNRVAIRILGKDGLPKAPRNVYARTTPPRGKRRTRCSTIS